jgi:hypothetical protein
MSKMDYQKSLKNKKKSLRDYLALLKEDYIENIELSDVKKKDINKIKYLNLKFNDIMVLYRDEKIPRRISYNELFSFFSRYWGSSIYGHVIGDSSRMDKEQINIVFPLFTWCKEVFKTEDFYLNALRKIKNQDEKAQLFMSTMNPQYKELSIIERAKIIVSEAEKEDYGEIQKAPIPKPTFNDEPSNKYRVKKEFKNILQIAGRIRKINSTRQVTENNILYALCTERKNKARRILKKYLPDFEDFLVFVKNNKLYNENFWKSGNNSLSLLKELGIDHNEYSQLFHLVHKKKNYKKKPGSAHYLYYSIMDMQYVEKFLTQEIGEKFKSFQLEIYWNILTLKGFIEVLREIKLREKAMKARKKY